MSTMISFARQNVTLLHVFLAILLTGTSHTARGCSIRGPLEGEKPPDISSVAYLEQKAEEASSIFRCELVSIGSEQQPIKGQDQDQDQRPVFPPGDDINAEQLVNCNVVEKWKGEGVVVGKPFVISTTYGHLCGLAETFVGNEGQEFLIYSSGSGKYERVSQGTYYDLTGDVTLWKDVPSAELGVLDSLRGDGGDVNPTQSPTLIASSNPTQSPTLIASSNPTQSPTLIASGSPSSVPTPPPRFEAITLSTEKFNRGAECGAFDVILDVRSLEEWEAGHIKGATHWKATDAREMMESMEGCIKCRIAIFGSNDGMLDETTSTMLDAGFERLYNGGNVTHMKEMGSLSSTSMESVMPKCITAGSDACTPQSRLFCPVKLKQLSNPVSKLEIDQLAILIPQEDADDVEYCTMLSKFRVEAASLAVDGVLPSISLAKKFRKKAKKLMKQRDCDSVLDGE